MASPAAVLSILVQARGISSTNAQLKGLHTGLGTSGAAATKMGNDLNDGARKGSKALGALKSGAGLAIGALGVAGLAGAVKTAVGEFEEARKVGANTNQVIKSTGGAAKISATQVAELATSISKKVGIDDEAIQSGANLLLTFKNIRNETGKGRDIFNQATAAAVDLSAAGFGSLESTSKQLGKALNDPVKGMTALGRSGVTFSEQQKKAIEALIKTGKASDRVKAQQMILKEVQSQVGGQAAAQATTMDKLRVTLGNLAEAAGAVLVPALDKIGKFLVLVINQMIEGQGAGGAIVSTFKSVGGAIGDLIAVGAGLVTFLKENKTLTLALAAAVGVFALAYTATLIPSLVIATAMIMSNVAAWIALRVAFLASPIGLVVTGIAALAAGLVIAYRESETFRDIVNGAWTVIKAVAGWLITAGVAAFNAVADAVKWAWNAIKTTTDVVWNAIKGVLTGVWGAIKTAATTYFNAYRTIVTGVWDAIQTATTTVWGAIKGIAVGVWEAIKLAATTVWGGIKTAIVNPIESAVSAVRNALGSEGLLGWLKARFDDFKSAAETLSKPFVTAFEKISGAVKDVLGWLDKVSSKVETVVDFIGKIKIPKINIPFIGGGPSGGPGRGPVPSAVDGFNDDAARFGNVVTSGFRPGDPGWHGKNRARDYAGGDMLGFARYMAANFGSKLLELIHTPLGFGIKNGAVVPPYAAADHYDHVHVALAKGGYVARSGWAVVGERGPELAHLPGGSSVYSNRDSKSMLGNGGGPLVHIEHAEFGNRVDENSFLERLAFRVANA